MLDLKVVKKITSKTVIVFVIIIILSLTILIKSKEHIFAWANNYVENQRKNSPFPVGVNIASKVIIDNPEVNIFYSETLSGSPTSKDRWWNKTAAVLSNKTWYQNLASPVSRIVVIWPGERKEEIAKNIGDILRWNREDRNAFLELVDSTEPIITDGKYFPGQYVTRLDATPDEVKQLISERFQAEILNRYTAKVSDQVPLTDALIIASLLEREAGDFYNMREVSGVIWNRLFINMPLQLDATLQYVKGSDLNEPKWWPAIRPADKFLKSPFNTYQNKNLPPSPIANSSAEAILAALNPIITDCLYYFHSIKGEYSCSATYEEHVAKLKIVYGQGS